MNQFFVGNTLINDAYIGNIRVDDVFTQPSLQVDYLVQAPGGSPGSSATTLVAGGGGGAGGLLTGSLFLFKNNINYQVIIGNPGTASAVQVAGQNGENNSIIGGVLNVVAIGGGGGGISSTAGKNGGSGGGAGHLSSVAGSGTMGQGNSGALGQGTSGSVGIGGGGGGAGSAGSGKFGGSGSIWLDGVYYGEGGTVDRLGDNPSIYGMGGNSYRSQRGNDGRYGTVIIRYPGTGSQMILSGSGVTTYFSASYTYHRFFTLGGVYNATQSFTY